PAKGYLLTARGLAGAQAFGAVAIEYLLYTLVSAWMAGGALAILLKRDLLPKPIRLPIEGVVAGTLAFTIGCAWAAVSGTGLVAPIVRGVAAPFGRNRAERVTARVAGVERVLVAFIRKRPARVIEVIATEAGGHALLAAEVWV